MIIQKTASITRACHIIITLHTTVYICICLSVIIFLFSIYIPPSESIVNTTPGLQICNLQNKFVNTASIRENLGDLLLWVEHVR